MSEINIKLKAQALGKALEDLSYEITDTLNEAIHDAVQAGYASIIGSANLGLSSTRKDYLSGLKLHELGENEYLIMLDGKFANSLESGFTGFDVKSGMLKSKKVVNVGVRAGQPWVQQSKADGHKFAHVPFQHRPFSRESQSADLGAAIRKLKAVNKQGVEQKFTKLFTDENGKALEGKVAVVKKVKGFPQLDRITKFQKTYKNEKTGKETVQSLYMTFRTVSEQGSEWQHPGFKGLKAFDDAEQMIDSQIDEILNRLLR
jgi:hypothetical protein